MPHLIPYFPATARVRMHVPAQTPWARWRQADPLDAGAASRPGAWLLCPVRIPLS